MFFPVDGKKKRGFRYRPNGNTLLVAAWKECTTLGATACDWAEWRHVFQFTSWWIGKWCWNDDHLANRRWNSTWDCGDRYGNESDDGRFRLGWPLLTRSLDAWHHLAGWTFGKGNSPLWTQQKMATSKLLQSMLLVLKMTLVLRILRARGSPIVC